MNKLKMIDMCIMTIALVCAIYCAMTTKEACLAWSCCALWIVKSMVEVGRR